jgi:SAM-dependent methyltransferase
MREPTDRPGTAPTSRQKKVSDWWSNEAARHAADGSYMLDWTCSPLIVRVLNRRATGSEDLNWLQWVKARLPGGKVDLALSVGCGRGMLERDALDQGLCVRMEGIDIAPGAIEIAVREAGDLPITYRVADLQKDDLEPLRYDAVFCASTLHHIKDLGHCLEQISDSLKDEGVFVLSEYAGPSRFQWEPEQLRRVMDVYSFLPATYRYNVIASGTVFFPERPGIAEMIEGDPSEAVRAAEMLDIVEWYFERVARLDTGGTLLNPLLSGIAGNFDTEAALDRSYLLLASLLEEMLIEAGVVTSDFMIDIYRKRPVPLLPPGGLESEAALCARIADQETELARLQDERREQGARYSLLESRYLQAGKSLEAAGPEERRLQEEIARLRAGGPPVALAAHPADEAGPGAPLAPTGERAMRLFASPDARAITGAAEGVPVWIQWAAEVIGCRPEGIDPAGGGAQLTFNGERFLVVFELAESAGPDSAFGERLNACLPEGWALVPERTAGVTPASGRTAGVPPAFPPTVIADTDSAPALLLASRCFLAGKIERPDSGDAMAQCVEDLVHYLVSEASALGLIGPALEVRIYSDRPEPVPEPERGKDISLLQEAEISRLESLLRAGDEATARMEREVGRLEKELARAGASLDALRRERDILQKPWPLRKAGMWLEARRRARLGL